MLREMIVATLALTPLTQALACTDDEIDRTFQALEEYEGDDPCGDGIYCELPPPDEPFTLYLSGMVASGAQAGGSCEASIYLPPGIEGVAFRIVNTQTGENVGFQPFERGTETATRLNRRGSSEQEAGWRYAGFRAKVSRDIARGVPMTFEIVLKNTAKDYSRLAFHEDMARNFVTLAGALDARGYPTHHLMALRPASVHWCEDGLKQEGRASLGCR